MGMFDGGGLGAIAKVAADPFGAATQAVTGQNLGWTGVADLATGQAGRLTDGSMQSAGKANVAQAYKVNKNNFAPARQSAATSQQYDLARLLMERAQAAPDNAFVGQTMGQLGQIGQNQNALVASMQRDLNAGPGPSIADLVAARQRDQAVKNIMAQTASARGANPAMALRGAQQQMALGNADMQQQQMLGRLQEQQQYQQMQMARQNQLGGLLSGMGQQALAGGEFQGQMQNQLNTQMQNQANQLAQHLYNTRNLDQQQNQYNADQNRLFEQAKLQEHLARQDANMRSADMASERRYAAQQADKNALIGGLTKAGSAFLGGL